MPIVKGIYIDSEFYTPGSQLSPAQIQAVTTYIQSGQISKLSPDILKQFLAQGGQIPPVDLGPAPVDTNVDSEWADSNPTTPPAIFDANTAPTPVDTNVDSEWADNNPTPVPPISDAIPYPTPVNDTVDPELLGFEVSSANAISANAINRAPEPVPVDPYYVPTVDLTETQASVPDSNSPLQADIAQTLNNARAQQVRAVQLGQAAQNGDWRVRLSLADGASYLYADPANPGILEPLQTTGGIIFPYTPKIDISYKANYQPYDPTHSNFRGYYYQNSQVGDIGITAHFTAQNTNDANYLLAVIHFLRSATKMFYGQDAQRGSPPPLLFLTGLGQYQFNKHPCLLTEFSYNLPEDVDYLRAQVTNQVDLNLTNQNTVKQSVPTNSIFASIQRLANAFTTKGALPNTPFGSPNVPNLAQGSPTYVPTKMDITIKLLPVNTRQQVSTQFSLKDYANGNQLKGGFW